MVYNTQNHWAWGLRVSFWILIAREHNVSEIESVSVFRWREGDIYSVIEVRSFYGTQQSRCLRPLIWRRKQIQFPKCCDFYSFRIPDDEQSSQIQWIWLLNVSLKRKLSVKRIQRKYAEKSIVQFFRISRHSSIFLVSSLTDGRPYSSIQDKSDIMRQQCAK
jgi:hypothetical protein